MSALEKIASNEDELQDHWQAVQEADDEQRRRNQRLLNAVKSIKGEPFYKDIQVLFDSLEVGGGFVQMPLLITRKKGGEYTRESCGEIKGYWIDQFVNGGMTGDSYEGYVYVKIKKDRYIQAYYSM
jgi:hypothetical protein